jgi:hypothetical protein
MDKGYDNNRVYGECRERRVHPIIPLRGDRRNAMQRAIDAIPADDTRLAPAIHRFSGRFKSLYNGRAAVEREFGRLKHDYGLAPLRVRGLERVQLHADLCILGRLAQALARARERAVPLAA